MEARFSLLENELAGKFVKRLIAASRVFEDSTLPTATQNLILIRASQINGCGVCLDMHTKDATYAGETPLRLNMVAAWREATVFTEPERAALALAEEGSRLADAHRGVSDETWELVRKHYDDDEIAALVATVAMINAWNRLNVVTKAPAGGYEPGQWS